MSRRYTATAAKGLALGCLPDTDQRITLEIEDLNDESRVAATNWGIQWQFKY